MATGYEPVIGLEVHAQLLTRSKLFCGCSARFGASPNQNVCPVCLGLPGALPVPNRRAIEMAIQAGLSLGCQVREQSRFARKNYFYPDLAKGYQISQFELPLNEHGTITLKMDGYDREVRIGRIHMEEDAAKNLHGVGSSTQTLVDFNRAGVPLVEIVSEPDLRTAEEAEAYLRQLREVLMFVGINDGNLEEGSFRCDANVSIRPVGSPVLGTRTELKNINSFRFVRLAIEYEIARQEVLVSGGGTVVQETRTWNEAKSMTVSMRGKEEAHDYRYFPDPDLPPVRCPETQVEELRRALPELPGATRARWEAELGLTPYDSAVLSAHPGVARHFDRCASVLIDAWGKDAAADAGKRAANFMQAEVLRVTQTEGLDAMIPVSSEQVAELLGLVRDGTINNKIAKEVFAEMVSTGEAASAVVERKGLSQVTDESAIEAEVDRVVTEHPDQAAQYRAGKTKMIGFFVGRVMKATAGKANPQIVNELLRKKLESP